METPPAISVPEGLEFRKSPIHGWGIFAIRDFPAEYNLGEFIGTPMNHKEFTEKYGRDRRHTYMNSRYWKYRVAKEQRNWITYLNDGQHNQSVSKVNVYLKRWCCYTLKPVAAGEEILLAYGRYYRWDLEE